MDAGGAMSRQNTRQIIGSNTNPAATSRLPLAGATALWAGDDLLVWGGVEPQAEDGALWNPEDGWRDIPAPPSPPGAGVGVAWTGEELYLAGSAASVQSGGPLPLASYDPVAGWRELPAAPLEARAGAETHWTGGELLVFGGSNELSSDSPFHDGALYDPEAGTWRTMTPAPLQRGLRGVVAAWTGRQLVIGATSENVESEYDVEEWLSYDLESDAWTVLPAPPVRVLALAANDKDAFEAQVYTDAVWTGEEVLLLHSEDRAIRTSGVALRLDTQSWRVLPDAPIHLPWDHPAPFATVWAGDRLIVLSQPDPQRPDLLSCAAYVPASNSWLPVPAAPIRPGQAAVWNGSAVLSWGGSDGEGTLRNDGKILTLPPD